MPLLTYACAVFLAGVFLALGLTAEASHVSEHVLVAVAIGYGTLTLAWLCRLGTRSKRVLAFVAAWWAGTMYYLGREVRDYQKGSGAFDWGGFLGPALGNIVVFAVSYVFYSGVRTPARSVAIPARDGARGSLVF